MLLIKYFNFTIHHIYYVRKSSGICSNLNVDMKSCNGNTGNMVQFFHMNMTIYWGPKRIRKFIRPWLHRKFTCWPMAIKRCWLPLCWETSSVWWFKPYVSYTRLLSTFTGESFTLPHPSAFPLSALSHIKLFLWKLLHLIALYITRDPLLPIQRKTAKHFTQKDIDVNIFHHPLCIYINHCVNKRIVSLFI